MKAKVWEDRMISTIAVIVILVILVAAITATSVASAAVLWGAAGIGGGLWALRLRL